MVPISLVIYQKKLVIVDRDRQITVDHNRQSLISFVND